MWTRETLFRALVRTSSNRCISGMAGWKFVFGQEDVQTLYKFLVGMPCTLVGKANTNANQLCGERPAAPKIKKKQLADRLPPWVGAPRVNPWVPFFSQFLGIYDER